jgi:hypothetical protein
LPPQNNSQAYQAQILKQEIPDIPGPQYNALLGIPEFKKFTDPGNTIKQILDSLILLQNNHNALRKLEDALDSFFNEGNIFIERLRNSESLFIEKMKNTADCDDSSTIQEAVLSL